MQDGSIHPDDEIYGSRKVTMENEAKKRLSDSPIDYSPQRLVSAELVLFCTEKIIETLLEVKQAIYDTDNAEEIDRLNRTIR